MTTDLMIVDNIHRQLNKLLKFLSFRSTRSHNLVNLENIIVDQNSMKTYQERTNCLNIINEDFNINKLHAALIYVAFNST